MRLHLYAPPWIHNQVSVAFPMLVSVSVYVFVCVGACVFVCGYMHACVSVCGLQAEGGSEGVDCGD